MSIETAAIEKEAEEEQVMWSRQTIARVMKIAGAKLSQRDLVSLLLVSPWIHRALASYSSLWIVLGYRETTRAGERIIAALVLPRYCHLKQINLEFSQDAKDRHVEMVRDEVILGCIETVTNNLLSHGEVMMNLATVHSKVLNIIRSLGL